MNTRALACSLLLTAALANAHAQPVITRQPTNQSVSLGASAKFQVSATSTNSPILFQWQFATTNVPTATSSSLTLTNIQIINAGDYDAVLTDGSGSVTSWVATLEVDPTFTHITQGDIVNARRDYRGIAWGDYDNDGHLDLFVTSTDGHGFAPWNYLYRNDGYGTFTSMPTNVVGNLVGPNGGSEGCTWSDYDRDGFLDLFVARYGNDQLFHDNGDGSFTRITNSPVVKDGKDEYQCAWTDYDNDGWPDLFMAAINSGGNFLYDNSGNGTLTRITSGAIATDRPADLPAPAWVDYNNDGLPDLFVGGGDTGPNFL